MSGSGLVESSWESRRALSSLTCRTRVGVARGTTPRALELSEIWAVQVRCPGGPPAQIATLDLVQRVSGLPTVVVVLSPAAWRLTVVPSERRGECVRGRVAGTVRYLGEAEIAAT